MVPVVDPASDAAAARDQFQHDLISALTTISGRAQLLNRTVQRSSTMTGGERRAMFDGLAIIEAAVHSLVTRFDAYSHMEADGRVGEEELAVLEAADASD